METLELKADVREVTGRKVKNLRQEGFIPAVLYGHTDTTLLQIAAKPLSKVLREAGTHQLISLQIGKKKPVTTLARDIQRDTIKHGYLHIDFYAVKMDEKVNAQVPLVLVGESPAVKDLGGVLTHGMDQIEIECLPSDLISAIEVNVAGLVELSQTITVSDLRVPSTVTILSDPDSVVAKIEPPRLIEEAAEAEEALEPGSVEPEVLTAAKGQEEDKE